MRGIIEVRTAEDVFKSADYISAKFGGYPMEDIFKYAVFEFKENRAIIRASGYSASLCYEIPAEVEEEGICTIPAKEMVKVCRKLEKDLALAVEKKEDNLVAVRSGSFSAEFRVQSPEAVPLLEAEGKEEEFEVESAPFFEALEAVKHAASKSDFDVHPGILITEGASVATDLHRMSAHRVNFNTGTELVIHAKSVSLIKSLFGDSDRLTISVSSDLITIKADGKALSIKTIDIRFPNWKTALEKIREAERFEVEVSAFLDAVSTLMVAGGEKVELSLEAEKLILRASDEENTISGLTSVPVSGNPAEFSVSVNPSYLLEALKAFRKEETVQFLYLAETAPIGLRTDAHLELIAPIREE